MIPGPTENHGRRRAHTLLRLPFPYPAPLPAGRSKQLFRPLVFPESGQHKAVAHKQRALHQHPVRRQQGQLLVLAHTGQLFRQFHLPVRDTAGVEKALQRQSADGMIRAQGLPVRMVRFDVRRFTGDPMIVQPLQGFFFFFSPAVAIYLQHDLHPPVLCVLPADSIP